MFQSNYFHWPFYAILVTLFAQTLLQKVDGNSDSDVIYTKIRELHEKLIHFQKVAQRIVEEGKIDSDIQNELIEREKSIKHSISEEWHKILEALKSNGNQILHDYLTLRKKVPPSLAEEMRIKWRQIKRPLAEEMRIKSRQIKRPLNVHDGKVYSEQELMHYNVLEILEVTEAVNWGFFLHLGQKCSHYFYADEETKKIMHTYTDLYDHLMAGVKLLREHRPTDEAKLQFQNEIDTMMMHEKTIEPKEMPEYLAELVFDEWTKKKNLYDADRLMAEVEKAMEKMKVEEETAVSNTEDLKANAKGKGKMKAWCDICGEFNDTG